MHYTPARAVAVPGRARRRMVGFVCAAPLQIAMVWAIMNGLAIKDIPVILGQTTAVFVPKPDKHPALPPEPTIEPTRVWVPNPEMPPIDNGGQKDTGITVVSTQPPPPPAGPSDHGPVSVMATHTIPPYPMVDLRLGNEGTVVLRLLVGADGRVLDAHLVHTSGSDGLDRAALAWVSSHWRYQPAIRGGAAVPSAVDVAVKFSLKNAG